MAWTYVANIKGNKGDKGEPGSPLDAAGWQFMKDTFDALDGSDPRVPYVSGDEGYLHSFPDSAGRQTWLGTRDTDGGPTAHGEWHLRHRLGIYHTPEGAMTGLTDSALFFTDLTVDESGQLADFVLDRVAPRIAQRIGGTGGGGGSGAGLSSADRMVNSAGDLVPVFPMMDRVIMWGSSSAEWGAPEFQEVFPDVLIVNEGKAAEWSTHIAARMGAIPALLTVTGGSIPASGPVEVTASNMSTTGALKTYAGRLAGVQGSLSSTNEAMTFTRSGSGSVVAVPAGTPFVPDLPAVYRQYVGFLWAGKNDLSTNGTVESVVSNTMTMFKYFTPLVKRALVLGHFVHSNQTPGSTQWGQVNLCNQRYAEEFGDLFVDVNSYILSPRVWTDTGITPTATDLQQQADGLKPDSISQDAGHLNTAGELAVAGFVREHCERIGWYAPIEEEEG